MEKILTHHYPNSPELLNPKTFGSWLDPSSCSSACNFRLRQSQLAGAGKRAERVEYWRRSILKAFDRYLPSADSETEKSKFNTITTDKRQLFNVLMGEITELKRKQNASVNEGLFKLLDSIQGDIWQEFIGDEYVQAILPSLASEGIEILQWNILPSPGQIYIKENGQTKKVGFNQGMIWALQQVRDKISSADFASKGNIRLQIGTTLRDQDGIIFFYNRSQYGNAYVISGDLQAWGGGDAAPEPVGNISIKFAVNPDKNAIASSPVKAVNVESFDNSKIKALDVLSIYFRVTV